MLYLDHACTELFSWPGAVTFECVIVTVKLPDNQRRRQEITVMKKSSQ